MSENLQDRLAKLEARVERLETERQAAESKPQVAWKTAETAHDQEVKSMWSLSRRSPSTATPSSGTELWLGKHGLSFVGILLLLLGMGFLLVYSIQYLGPWGRDLLGLGAALILFLISRTIERTMKGFGQFLFAGSAALTYFTVYAMHFFDVSRVITSQPLDLFLLFIVGVATTWYALTHYKTETATTVAYALIYLTFWVGDLGLFSFWALLLATAGIAGLSAWKKWPGALLAGVLLTYGTYLLWGAELGGGTTQLFGSSSQLTFDALFLSLYFLLFSLPTFALKEDDPQSPVVVLVMNAALYAVLFGMSLEQDFQRGLSYVLFGLSIFHYLYALVANLYQKPKLQEAAVVVGSLSLLGAIPLYYTDVTIAWGWLLVGAAQLLLSLTLKLPTLRGTGLVGISLAALHFFFIDLLVGDVLGSTTLTERLALGLVMAVLTLGIAQIYRHRLGEAESTGLRLYLNLIGGGALVGLAGVELEATYITLAWGLLGVVALLAGIALKDQQLRNPAFAAIVLMLVRVVFVDLAEAETVVRIVSFIVLGIILLGASWVYHRFLSDEQTNS